MRSGIGTTGDGPLFNVKEGRALRDRGIKQADDSVHERWKAAFLGEAYRLVYAGRDFTSEDIIAVAGMPPDGTSPSAVGALIRGLVNKNAIRPTGGIRQSKRPSSHAAMLRVWTRAS